MCFCILRVGGCVSEATVGGDAGVKALWATAIMGFRMYFRDRSSVFWGMMFPILLMALIGVAFGRVE
jgi:hypothetical protein